MGTSYVLHGTTGDYCGTVKPDFFHGPAQASNSSPFKVDRIYSFSVKSKITVAILTKKITVTHCTAKKCMALNSFPGIKKWLQNHNYLINHGWTAQLYPTTI